MFILNLRIDLNYMLNASLCSLAEMLREMVLKCLKLTAGGWIGRGDQQVAAVRSDCGCNEEMLPSPRDSARPQVISTLKIGYLLPNFVSLLH